MPAPPVPTNLTAKEQEIWLLGFKAGISAKSSRIVDHPLYSRYRGMLARCFNPKRDSYRNYGARGITVCDRWRYGEGGKTGFQCFLDDVGMPPTLKHSLDRFPDMCGNYEPGNVRWATIDEQTNNQRPWRKGVPVGSLNLTRANEVKTVDAIDENASEKSLEIHG